MDYIIVGDCTKDKIKDSHIKNNVATVEGEKYIFSNPFEKDPGVKDGYALIYAVKKGESNLFSLIHYLVTDENYFPEYDEILISGDDVDHYFSPIDGLQINGIHIYDINEFLIKKLFINWVHPTAIFEDNFKEYLNNEKFINGLKQAILNSKYEVDIDESYGHFELNYIKIKEEHSKDVYDFIKSYFMKYSGNKYKK